MRRLLAGAAVALALVACRPVGAGRSETDAAARDWLRAQNAGQAEWAAGFYAPDALIRDSDGVTFRGARAASAWERLTSGLYRYQVENATWTDADTLRLDGSAAPLQYVAPPRHFELTAQNGQITGLDWFAIDGQASANGATPLAPDSAPWPFPLAGAAATAALWACGWRRRPGPSGRRRLDMLEPLRALAESRRDA